MIAVEFVSLIAPIGGVAIGLLAAFTGWRERTRSAALNDRVSDTAANQQLIDGWRGLSAEEALSWRRRLDNLDAELIIAKSHQHECEVELAVVRAELAPLRARVVELERLVRQQAEPRTVTEQSTTTTVTSSQPEVAPVAETT